MADIHMDRIAGEDGVIPFAGDEETLRAVLNTLPSAINVHRRVRGQMRSIARIGIERLITDIEEDFRIAYPAQPIPDALKDMIRIRAHLNYVRYCACLTKDIKAAAFDTTSCI